MLTRLLSNIRSNQSKSLFIGFASIIVASAWLCAALDSLYPLAIPAFALLVYITIVDFKSIYFLLLACIPISIEFELTDSFATDLPTEPLTVGLMLVLGLYVAKNYKILRGSPILRHPITLLLLAHFAWIFITMLNSESLYFSVKHFLAKGWYIVTFYFLTILMLREKRDYVHFFRCVAIPLSMAVIITILRHASYDFSFEHINRVMSPMFRNHVNYGCAIAVFLPYLIMGRSWQQRGNLWWWILTAIILIFLAAIQLSFTRAAYVAIIGAMGYYFVVKWRLTKVVVGLACVAMIAGMAYLVNGNKYLDFAPKFERAVTHTKFDNLLEATAKGEDISTMERVYRWVAGVRMVSEKPYMGFGGNNFYNFYKSYTVTSFRTYVSENEDHSTVHCYYLLIAIEQGIIGLLLFLLLVFYILIKGEQVYHKVSEDYKSIAMATLLSFVIILILNLINDLVETDKIGSFFFICMAIIANLDRKIENAVEKG
jgi:O-antigen ligase